MVDHEGTELRRARTVEGRAADLRAARDEEVAVAAGPGAHEEFGREAELEADRHHDRRRDGRREDHGREAEGDDAEEPRGFLSGRREDFGKHLRVLIEEGAREPSDAEDAHDADEARAEDRARSELVRGHAAQKNDHEGGREHHHLDERRDRELRNLFAHRPFGAQARNGTDQDRAENADQEDRDGELGIGFGLSVRGPYGNRGGPNGRG